jgi:hypothetical protein
VGVLVGLAVGVSVTVAVGVEEAVGAVERVGAHAAKPVTMVSATVMKRICLMTTEQYP